MDAIATPSSPRAVSDRAFFVFNAVVSALALSLLFWLLVVHRGAAGSGVDLHFMPAVNAGLNSLSAVLLVGGFVAIRRKRPDIHRYFMVSAFASSALFLVGYLAYHYVHGDTRYAGAFRPVYLAVLLSHILLSTSVLPMALSAFYFAWKRKFAVHKRITRVLLPIWLYVSVTGVVVFLMLRGSPTALP